MSGPTRDELMVALNNDGAYCGDCDYESGLGCSACRRVLGSYADVVQALYAAHPVEPAPVADRQSIADVVIETYLKGGAHLEVALEAGQDIADTLLAAGVFRSEAEVKAEALEEEAARAKADAEQQRRSEDADLSFVRQGTTTEAEMHFWYVHNRLVASAKALRAGDPS